MHSLLNKKQIEWLLKAILLLVSTMNLPVLASAGILPKSDTLKVFLIGNSFSQNATRYLPQLAAEGGHPLKIGRAELGGCSLQRHWEIAEAAEKNPQDQKGMAYKGQSLRQLLEADQWDIVTIQQNSMNSGDVTTYSPYAEKLYQLIKSIRPNAQVVIHQTWAYRTDAKLFSQIAKDQHASDAGQMWETSRAAYHTLAKKLQLPLIPVGDAFYRVTTRPETAYRPDTHYNFETPDFPNLPDQTNSLHVGYRWDNSQKLAFDANHANEAGCYLGGLVWYAFLFHETPAHLTFKPEKVTDAFAKYLKQAASTVMKQENRTGK